MVIRRMDLDLDQGGRTRYFAAFYACRKRQCIGDSCSEVTLYEPSPDTVRDVFYVLSLGPHFCYPIK